jgi:hypothetical protein
MQVPGEVCDKPNKESHTDLYSQDTMKPSERLAFLCSGRQTTCYNGDGGVGVMCIGGNFDNCQEAIDYANSIQSWSGSWWLEDRIDCDGFYVTITSQ